MFGILKKIFGTAQERQLNKYRKIIPIINEWEQKFKSLSDEELKNKTQEFKERIKQGESLEDILPEAYATVKSACSRMIGTPVHVSGYDQPWDMVPYDVQLLGGIAMHYGTIAEMQTGEGKTLTAVLPLYLNALTGRSVHLVTVNDYLAKRDSQWVGSILRWLGLTTGALTGDSPIEQRKEIYACDVVYGTASEFGFDYLRDNSMVMDKRDQVQRDHYFAIIDEIDSILIDEARTPLIISGPAPESNQQYEELKEGVANLVRYQRDLCNRLASEAKKALDPIFKEEDLSLKKKKMRDENIQEALKKLWLVGKGMPRHKVLKRAMEDPECRAALNDWDLYYYSDQNKEERQEELAKLFLTVNEKSNEYELTDKGIQAWPECTNGKGKIDDFVMLDLSEEFIKIDNDPDISEEAKVNLRLKVQEQDAIRKERAHNLRQMLRAHLLMERDVDYIVQDGKVIIVDENTGRPQPGRRFSDGLHQAIEAKEGVTIEKETQTYATITLQNYFRLYDKLSGMTGTAATEAQEFKDIYSLDVLEIPTHKPCIRKDFDDEIYMTEREKYNAILKNVKELHAQGRPILIGSDSVEVSEKLSRIFRQHRLPHTVLNAKHHEQEAEIIANAGKKGAITIATNMAGRGTDIKLEEGVADLGGLHVIGSTRHQARRIDRQLRGRCARQGDPGSSKFYISFEDSLMRLFASPTLSNILQKFRPPEGEPISAKILNRSIETAQKRVEQRNYVMRKHTLEYDDVMNKQRHEIYNFRNEILRSDDIIGLTSELLEEVCHLEAEKHFQNKDPQQALTDYLNKLMEQFPLTFKEEDFANDSPDEIAKKVSDKIIDEFKEKIEWENQKVPEEFKNQEGRLSPAEEAIRNIMIRTLDKLWQEHLLKMDHLRSDVSLRVAGQRDPLMEFKQEAFILFDELSKTLYSDITHTLFRFEIVGLKDQLEAQKQALSDIHLETDKQMIPELNATQTHTQISDEEKLTPIHKEPKAKRNDPCPCGSGKKYKKCCGKAIVSSD